MMKPTTPYDDRQPDLARDFAGAGKFSLYALERMLRSCANQPLWRARADMADAYYHGRQLTPDMKRRAREEGLDERVINLIRPVINSVLGQEARSRTDVRLTPDDDQYADVAEAISVKLKEAERETNAHMGVSNAYADMMKKGVGWTHVYKGSDPLAYPYKFEHVPLEEVWWDWQGQRGTTLTDSCRWLVRMRFLDLDEVTAAMPDRKEVLENSVRDWDQFLNNDGGILGEPEHFKHYEDYDNERRFGQSFAKWDWCNSERKMVKMFEVWYRVPATVVVLEFSPTKRVEYDAKNKRHADLIARGLVKVSKGVTSQVRRALYAGPHRLLDEATTYRRFPYFPFFAFRDGLDNSPYGLVDGMIAPQDDYNERRQRIQWMLKAKQVYMDSDALDTNYNSIQDIADAVMRPDLQVILNPARMNRGEGVVVKNELSMQSEQFEVMADSKQSIQDAAGRYSSQLGNAQVQSGIANSLLIQQGEQSMGELNDNYSHSRKAAFEHLVDLICEDYSKERLEVTVGGSGGAKRVIVLNDFTPEGQPINCVKDATLKTGLADVPSSPAYKQQQQGNIATIIQALQGNPNAVAILTPSFLEAASLKQEADDFRKLSGLPSPGDKEAQAAATAQQQQAAQQTAQQQAAMQDATIREKSASADKQAADASLAQAKTSLIQVEIGGIATQQAAKSDEDDLIRQALEASA
jgi:hypothetical protein